MPTLTSSKSRKYVELAQSLAADIDAGTFKPGDRLPTYENLTSRFKVTISTLDRALVELEQGGRVRREPGRGVFVAETKSRVKGVIGLIGFGNKAVCTLPVEVGPTSFTSYFFSAHLMEGLDDVLQKRDVGMMLLNRQSTTNWDKVDGIMAFNLSALSLEELRQELPAYMPCVSLLDAADSVSTVMADDYSGAHSAVQYLLQLGHRRIGCLLSRRAAIPRMRMAGYQHALQDAGIEPEANWAIPPVELREPTVNFTEWGRESVRRWLQDGWKRSRCTAIFVQNDWAAIGAIGALQEAGLRVPDDISVIGFDGTEACQLTTPKITAVEVPLREIARSGAELLLRKIESGNNMPHERIVLPTHLQIRESTAPPPANKD
jgi:LacI family transcriptional regulator